MIKSFQQKENVKLSLPRYIETNEDVLEWEEYLKKIPQEEIVGFILDRMITDEKFLKLVCGRFINDDYSKNLKGILDAFDNEVYGAYQSKAVDTEYVVAITKNFIRAVDAIGIEDAKKEGYEHMAHALLDGWKNYGLGFPDDEEIIDEILQELGSSLDDI